MIEIIGGHLADLTDRFVGYGEKKLGVPLPDPTYFGGSRDDLDEVSSRINHDQVQWGIDVVKCTVFDPVRALIERLSTRS